MVSLSVPKRRLPRGVRESPSEPENEPKAVYELGDNELPMAAGVDMARLVGTSIGTEARLTDAEVVVESEVEVVRGGTNIPAKFACRFEVYGFESVADVDSIGAELRMPSTDERKALRGSDCRSSSGSVRCRRTERPGTGSAIGMADVVRDGGAIEGGGIMLVSPLFDEIEPRDEQLPLAEVFPPEAASIADRLETLDELRVGFGAAVKADCCNAAVSSDLLLCDAGGASLVSPSSEPTADEVRERLSPLAVSCFLDRERRRRGPSLTPGRSSWLYSSGFTGTVRLPAPTAFSLSTDHRSGIWPSNHHHHHHH